MNDWIPVENDLPPPGEVVLVLGPVEPAITAYRVRGEWRIHDSHDFIVGVTLWHHIPSTTA